MEEPNYSKREQDLFRAENKDQFERLMAAINSMKTSHENKLNKIEATQGVDHKTLEMLCVTVSDNSGSITELWKAHKLIEDITTVYKSLKWFIYFVIGISSLIVALKIIFSAGWLKTLATLTKII